MGLYITIYGIIYLYIGDGIILFTDLILYISPKFMYMGIYPKFFLNFFLKNLCIWGFIQNFLKFF